ncbi:MAG: hypothetical protein AAF989_09330, partial [Planctomycetota bacterium]
MVNSPNECSLWRFLAAVGAFLIVAEAGLAQSGDPQRESDYYRLVPVAIGTTISDSRADNWKPGDELALEVSGLAPYDDERIAVAIRKGEVWLVGGAYDDPPQSLTLHRFATALHEPLGLLRRGGDLLTVQRTEVTRLRDTDGDDVADEYLTVAKGWGVTGHYHEYAYGPKLDGNGDIWLTLNIGLGLKGEQLERTTTSGLGYRQGLWRGWGMRIDSAGTLLPMCAGMRSPSGLGANRDGQMFYTDQQGNWVPTNSLHHMRTGVFFHHPEALASMDDSGSPLSGIEDVPNGIPYPQ